MDSDERDFTCCGRHVHKATRRYAILLLILTFGTLIHFVVEKIIHPKDYKFDWKIHVKLTLYPIKFICFWLLLYGNMKRKACYYKPALIFLSLTCIFFIVSFLCYAYLSILFITSGIDHEYIKEKLPFKPASLILIYTLLLGLASWAVFYMIRVIYRSYKLLQNSEFGELPVEYDCCEDEQMAYSESEKETVCDQDGRQVAYEQQITFYTRVV